MDNEAGQMNIFCLRAIPSTESVHGVVTCKVLLKKWVERCCDWAKIRVSLQGGWQPLAWMIIRFSLGVRGFQTVLSGGRFN